MSFLELLSAVRKGVHDIVHELHHVSKYNFRVPLHFLTCLINVVEEVVDEIDFIVIDFSGLTMPKTKGYNNNEKNQAPDKLISGASFRQPFS